MPRRNVNRRLERLFLSGGLNGTSSNWQHLLCRFGHCRSENRSSVTNASEAVATSTAHGYSNGDIVIMYSGWGRLNKRAFRIKSVATDTFVLEGCDTTNTNFFPSGGGVGTVTKISTFTQITTVMNPSSSGGDPKTVNYKFVESDVEYSINDGFSATSYTLEMDADSIGSAGYTALKSLTDVQTDTVLKIITRSGSISLCPCTVALNESVAMGGPDQPRESRV